MKELSIRPSINVYVYPHVVLSIYTLRSLHLPIYLFVTHVSPCIHLSIYPSLYYLDACVELQIHTRLRIQKHLQTYLHVLVCRCVLSKDRGRCRRRLKKAVEEGGSEGGLGTQS